jgi:hypothetical protein
MKEKEVKVENMLKPQEIFFEVVGACWGQGAPPQTP